MKQIIRDYLTFNKRERNGLFVLLSIITLLIVYLSISPLFIQPEITDFSKFEKEINQLNASVHAENDSLKEEYKNNFIDQNKKITDNGTENNLGNSEPHYFSFNPNSLPSNDWKKLGFSDKQIQVIKNYEAKGGKFKSKEDLKKMYGISPKQYLLLEPYIQLDIQKQEPDKKESIRSISKKEVLELNSSDSAQLVSLKGIGAFYAKAIIKYRTLLGGFVVKEQLLEIWKFDDVKLEEIKDKITIDDSNLKKININTCTAKELKHPYLDWNMANAIYNYRSKHGKYKTLDEIKKTDLIDDKTYGKIAPYLILE